MRPSTYKALLVIADISGFTQFMKSHKQAGSHAMQVVVELRYWEQMNSSEISRALGIPAAALTVACVGRACERTDETTARVPFCPLPDPLKRDVANGYREGRSPDVLGVSDGTPVYTELEGLRAPWPSVGTPSDTRVPLVLWGAGVSPGVEEIPTGTTLDRIAPTVAEILANPKNLTYHLLAYNPDYPRYGQDDLIECGHPVPELEALLRQTMVLHNQYPWDRAKTRLIEVGQDVGQVFDPDAAALLDGRTLEVLEALRGATHEVVVGGDHARGHEHAILQRRIGGDVALALELAVAPYLAEVLDGDAAAERLSADGLQPEGTMVRRATLEDVFLLLTGRSLEEFAEFVLVCLDADTLVEGVDLVRESVARAREHLAKHDYQAAVHVAAIPWWLEVTLTTRELDVAVTPPPRPFTTVEALLDAFDRNAAAGRAALAGAADADFAATWSLKEGSQTHFTAPRSAVVRSFVMSHLIHHRAQLGVYLRLRDVPTADRARS